MPAAHDVVVITTHDIGRHLGCYGVRSVASPNLDALAAGGVRYGQAFATAPQCSPSRASLASGLHPHQNGVLGLAHQGFDWDLRVPHAAAAFAGLGFETHLFGGQHVTPRPERLGFAIMHGQAPDAVVAGRVAALLDEAPRDRRLYLEINFEATHRPYPEPREPPGKVDVPAFLPDLPEARSELGALQGAIAEMDAAAGAVLDALDRAGRADAAFVVFTTDHGLAMPGAKCTLYDPGLEVAMLLRWPAGGLAGGAVSDDLVSNVDVLPTLLSAARGEAAALPARGGVFAEKTFHSYYDPMRCIRTRRHKLIRNFENAFAIEVPADVQAGPTFRADPARYSRDRRSVVEVYDLEADPLERANLAGRLDLERELSAELWRWMRETGDPLLDGPVASPWYRLAREGLQ